MQHQISRCYRYGQASIIEDDEGKKAGLDISMKKHSNK